jgi:UDP-3-O-[3-hydroxymyristoyl] glucosamine N-acyltransferase
MPLTLHELSRHLNLKYEGEANLILTGVASLTSAQPGDLCFLLDSKYLGDALASACSALIVPDNFDTTGMTKACLFSKSPQLSFARAIPFINPDLVDTNLSGIHPSAQIADSAILGNDVAVGALCVIGEQVQIGDGCQIGAGSVIEKQARLGESCRLHSRVTLAKRVQIGNHCILHSGSVIGSDGYGLVEENQHWHKIPQIGTVILGNDVEIGANTAIDRGALDNTIIEDGCKLDNLIQVAHNVRIGAHTVIAGCVGIAGSSNIGRYCKISGGAVLTGHLSIVDHVTITARSVVSKSIKEPGIYSSGTPILENSLWHKSNARYKSLDKLARTVARLDKQLKS